MLSLWVLFGVLIVVCLGIDLGLGSKRVGRMSVRTAAVWSVIWITLAGCFAVVVYFFPPEGRTGRDAAILFVTGYLTEKALSVDNMFVFIMLFSYFAVKDEDQPRVLKWGILGALVFRGALISMAYALTKFEWVLYIFGALLVYAAYKMLTSDEEEIEPEKNPVLLIARKFFPIVNRYDGHHFFIREEGTVKGTALLVVLLAVESTDVVFALDSIPAIFGIFPKNPKTGVLDVDFFTVFTSNVFAILGLRALFFVLAGIMAIFRYLKIGVAVILFFIAGKMLLKEVDFVHHALTPPISLSVIGGILAVSILASMFIKAPPEAEETGEKKPEKHAHLDPEKVHEPAAALEKKQ